jgi:hypothetical protein
VKAVLLPSKWGPQIDLAKLGIQLPNSRTKAFLSHHGKASDFTLGQSYNVEVFYSFLYPQTPDKANHTWTEVTAKTIETLRQNKHCKDKNIVAYFKILA